MKKLILALALTLGALHAQPPCVQITDTLYSMGPSGNVLMTGFIQLSLGYFTSNGAFTITQSLTTLTITAKANNLSACITPSVIVQANYTVTTGGRTPVHYTTYWYVPNTGGPYQLTSVPSGLVNVNGTPGVVLSQSGLNFALVSVNDNVTINGGAAQSVASVQGVTQLTLYSGLGTLTGVTFSAGPIERGASRQSGVNPPSIYGPPGAPGSTVLVGATIYVDSINGNDITGTRGNPGKPFHTVRAATTASGISSGDLIQIGPGTFNETMSPQTPVVFPSGVSVACASPTSTTLENDNPTTTLIIGFIPGSNSTLRNCTLQGNYNSTTLFEGPVGTDASTYGNIVTNVTLINDVVLGGTDGIYLRDSLSVQTPLYWRVIDCTVVTAWDTFVLAQPGGASVSWPAVVDIFNTNLLPTYNGSSGTSWRGINNNSLGTVTNMFGGRIVVVGGNSSGGSHTVPVESIRSTVNLQGVATSVSNISGTLFSLSASNGGVINANSATIFNPALTVISQVSPAGTLNITGTIITFGTPATSSDICAVPQIKFDAVFIYTCVAVNTWRRGATSSW